MKSRCLCGVIQDIGPSGRPAPHPPHKMLRRAIEMAGGAINISGYYPPSPEIWRWAKRNGVL